LRQNILGFSLVCLLFLLSIGLHPATALRNSISVMSVLLVSLFGPSPTLIHTEAQL